MGGSARPCSSIRAPGCALASAPVIAGMAAGATGSVMAVSLPIGSIQLTQSQAGEEAGTGDNAGVQLCLLKGFGNHGVRDHGQDRSGSQGDPRSEEHTSELQSRGHLVCRLLLEKKKQATTGETTTAQTSCRTQIAAKT